MGYLEGGPHHPPPISPTGHGGAVPTCRTLGMRVIPVAPLENAYRPRPYTGVMGVLSALRTVARHTCALAATPCRERHNVTHRKGITEWTGTSEHSVGRAIPRGSMYPPGYGLSVKMETVTDGWSASGS